jgi:hypothetical protein
VAAVFDIKNIAEEDSIAKEIGNLWVHYKSQRAVWENSTKEVREYLVATDTTHTSNSALPWKNKTTLPKLTQIRDTLHANYMAALFPHDDWFVWKGDNEDSETLEKRRVITEYMKNKIRQGRFKQTVSKMLLDYIDMGNVCGSATYVNETTTDNEGNTVTVYAGCKANRVSMHDIVFDVTAPDFYSAPKVTRSILTIGELSKMREQGENIDWIDDAFLNALELRKSMAGVSRSRFKAHGLMVDGFSSAYDYFKSGKVEVLEFEGDLYDQNEGNLHKNARIIVIDRLWVAWQGTFDSWLGRSNKEHAGWRERPDNLMAMSPLENLVGMQYRIDHLENLKADAFDLIAHPIVYQKGFVEDWDYAPNERIYGEVDSDVQFLRPDTTVLNADMQIDRLMSHMEMMAGAPREAAGFRTPGEKTKYEVQSLENAASRIFQHKIAYFEEMMLEPLLNQMLEQSRRNLDTVDLIRMGTEQEDSVEFMSITAEDLKASGRLYPVGSRNFARQTQLAQNLMAVTNSAAYQDPAVNSHISGVEVARQMTELSDLGGATSRLFGENIRISEQLDTQRLAQTAEREAQNEAAIDPQLAVAGGGEPEPNMEAMLSGMGGGAPQGVPEG